VGIRELDSADVDRVDLTVSGDLTVIGWEKPTISYSTDNDSELEDEIQRRGDRTLSLRSDGDVRLSVPHRLAVQVFDADGDARIRGVHGGTTIDNVDGDLRLEDVGGDIRINHCSGDVNGTRLHGTVSLDSSDGDASFNQVHGDLACGRVEGDLSVGQVEGQVTSDSVNGDASFRVVNGSVHVTHTGGDLKIAECGMVDVDHVSGDLALQDAREDVRIDNVGGDSTVSRIRGMLTLRNTGGGFTAKDLAGGMLVDSVGGRARISTGFTAGREYAVKCGGSATILLTQDPANASLSFELRSNGNGRIEVDGPAEANDGEKGVVRGTWGDGQATLRVVSNGGVRLLVGDRNRESDNFFSGLFEGIGEEIQGAFSAFASTGGFELERQIREKTERAAQRAEDTVRRVAERAERQAQEAGRRAAAEAEKQAQRAAERAQRSGERAGRHAERSAWHWNWRGQSGGGWVPQPPSPPPPPPFASPPPRPRVNEEERLLILQMVAEGTISSNEAAKLLEVLGS
jgi:hypothetical protein